MMTMIVMKIVMTIDSIMITHTTITTPKIINDDDDDQPITLITLTIFIHDSK